MDIWILIAAAGSGYLAHLRESFQWSKDAFGDVTDDDNDQSRSPSHTTPTRKCSYFSSLRRKSVKGGLHRHWYFPKLNQSRGAIPGECLTKLYLPHSDDSEILKAQASHNSLREDVCSSPSKSKCHIRRYAPAQSHTTSAHRRCPDMRNVNYIWPQNCCGFALSMNSSSKFAGALQDNWHPCMSNIYSKDHPDPCKMDKLSECSPGRYVKGGRDVVMMKEEQAFSLITTWRTSHQDQSEEACAFTSNDANIVRECEFCNSWKVMLHQKDERGHHFTKGRSDKVDCKGSDNNLLKMLLFNFGVGVGMMLAIMSSGHGKWQSVGQLEEAVCALKSLEKEVQNIKDLRIGLDSARDKRENGFAEQSHFVLKLVQKVLNSVEQVRISLLKNSASASAIDRECPQERARLEAELEAELERMEMDLYLKMDPNCRDATELCKQSSCANQDELTIGNVVQGELSARNIPCDVDAHSSILDGYNSSRRGSNWAIPPVELAKRLYEVLEARQKERILELEAESKHLDSRLQAKELEFHAWKQRVRDLLQETACISLASLQKDVDVEAQDTSLKFLASSTDKENCSAIAPKCRVSLLRNNEEYMDLSVDSAYSLSPSISQPKTCGGDEAHEKLHEQHLQLSNESASACPSHSLHGLLKIEDERDHWSRSVTMVHPEVMQASFSSTSSGSSHVATINDLEYPSSETLVDTETVPQDNLNNQLTSDLQIVTSSRHKFFGKECDVEKMPCPDTCGQDVVEINDNHGQFGQVSDSSMSEECSNSSDMDEQMGQRLIQRIVQKGRKGSLIVEVAKSAMDSFDLEP